MTTIAQALAGKLLAKAAADVQPGTYEIDEVLTVRICGTAVRQEDELVTPTTSIPYVRAMALLLEKSGITRDAATRLLREALQEAMAGSHEDREEAIDERINDVETAIRTVRKQVIAQLPKVPRRGKLVADVSIAIEDIADWQVQLQDAVEAKQEQLSCS